MAQILFIVNREMRVIPRGWQHPKDNAGEHVPLLPEGAWREEPSYAREACMPETDGLGDATEIVAYETFSEGTPISPAFPNTPQGRLALVAHCAEHCTTDGTHRTGAEAWAAILFGGTAAVDLDGTVRA